MPDYGVIDCHVHIAPIRMMNPKTLQVMRRRRPEFDFLLELMDSPAALLKHMDAEGIERLTAINYVAPDIIGFTEDVNEWVIQYTRHAPKRLLPCGSVDPRRSKDPAGDTRRIIDMGIRLIKIHPPHQLMFPHAYQDGLTGLADIYRVAEETGTPVMFHTGTSIFEGARNRYGDPLFLDDVAVDFPKMKIIVAHGGRPLWMNNAVFIVRRHPNVFLEVSSIPPKSLLSYFPRLEEMADKTMFGSDWPGPLVPGMGQNLRDFLTLPLSDGAKRKMLRTTALRVQWGESEDR